jgi:cell division protein FtsL
MAKLRSGIGRAKKAKTEFRNTKRKTVSQKVRESESLLVFLMAFFLCAVSISYILQTNSIATRGYEVEQYESQLSKLKNENQNMKNQEAELRSIKNLEGEKNRLVDVASSDINYVTAGNTAVAMRQ